MSVNLNGINFTTWDDVEKKKLQKVICVSHLLVN